MTVALRRRRRSHDPTVVWHDHPSARRLGRPVGSALTSIVVLSSLLVAASPAEGADTDQVGITAQVTIADAAEACVLLDTAALDFGVLGFGQAESGSPYTVTSCSTADQELLAAATDAAGILDPAVSWELVDGAGSPQVDAFSVDAALDGADPIWLATDPTPVGSLAAAAGVTATNLLQMPADGSQGAGQTLGFDVIWTATLDVVEPTWSSQTSGTTQRLHGVSFVDRHNGWAVGNDGTILSTADGGDVWTTQSSGTSESLRDVIFVDAENGWAVGYGSTILATSDGGTTWTAQSTDHQMDSRAVEFVDTQRGWIVGNAGVILATTDGGTTWTAKAPLQNLLGVSFLDAQTGWVVGTSGRILATLNGGTTWTAQTSGTTEQLNGLTFIDDKTGWVVGHDGTILATIDGGTTWTAQESGTTQTLNRVEFLDAETGWVVGFGATILSTVDGGTNWTPQSVPTRYSLYDVSFVDARAGWVVGDVGTILAYR